MNERKKERIYIALIRLSSQRYLLATEAITFESFFANVSVDRDEVCSTA